jgi:hypothetical protein
MQTYADDLFRYTHINGLFFLARQSQINAALDRVSLKPSVEMSDPRVFETVLDRMFYTLAQTSVAGSA